LHDDIVRVILDGTVVKVRLDKRSTGISVLVALGIRRDGQKVLLGLRNMGGESEAAWRAFLRLSGIPYLAGRFQYQAVIAFANRSPKMTAI
jgi:hypothetical protein